jgi:tRNA threonylcarbamoyl adenosine modification protein YeaZ
MTLLAIDFSSPHRSVAVLRGNLKEKASPVLSEVVETGTLSTHAFDMIDSALREAALEREQIECLAVGLGPGSYTGIRAAIALAQGWQLARAIKLVGVSSAEAIAAQARADGVTGHVGVVIDAQRNEFYLAEYELGAGSRREIAPLRLVASVEVQAKQDAGAVLIGPEVTRWFANGRLMFPRAAAVGALAQQAQGFVPGEKLQPIYLRETKFVKAPKPKALP